MKVVHISTHDVAGGAARAASRVHEGLLGIGVDSTMLVAVRAGRAPGVELVQIDRSLVARVRRRGRKMRRIADWQRHAASVPAGFERFSDDRTELGRDLVRQLPAADILHLHWVADLVDYGTFFPRIGNRTPLVWTLHDMNPMTGGCHYDAGCGRFTGRCGACPQLGSDEERDLSRRVWSRKQEALRSIPSGNLHIVTGSGWLAEEAQRSTLLRRFPVSTFHYGIDADVYRPRERVSARASLGIDPSARVLLFVADSLDNRRKGFSFLVDALKRLPPALPVCLVSIGRGAPEVPACRGPVVHVGYVDDDTTLSTVYSAADLFVMPSIQEAYGQTALEAMACGTPVVGFEAGGIRDVIRDGETGLVVRTGDAEALASAVATLLGDPARLARMRARCREVVLTEHSMRSEAERYLALYEDLRSAGAIG